MTDSTGGGEGVALARSIARTSRPAGSDAERQARAECAAYLKSRGFEVSEQLFEFAAWTGRWAVPAAGTCIAICGIGGAWAVAAGRPRLGALLAIVPVICALAARWGWKAGPFRGRVRTGTNLVGRRGVPDVWLIAHLDTKGQPVSLLVRAAGVILVAVGWLVTLCGWIVLAVGSGAVAAPVLVAGLLLAGVGGLPLAGSVVIDRGTGALDNASGIGCIFESIDQLDSDFSVGVLVTTAEELALAGARAWADREPPGIAINCDGVDDEGQVVCVMGADRSGRLAQAIEEACVVTGMRARVRRSLPGVLFDSVALADAGWDAMTVTRGTLRSLARVHTARDTLAAWQGRGVGSVATLVAAMVGAIVSEQHAVQEKAIIPRGGRST